MKKEVYIKATIVGEGVEVELVGSIDELALLQIAIEHVIEKAVIEKAKKDVAGFINMINTITQISKN